jgi:hypothetical protein
MPGARTATQLVRQVRESMQEMGSGSFRDGFSSDADTSTELIGLLTFVNRAISIFSRSGIVQDDYSFATSPSGYAVNMPMGAGRIVEVSIIGSGYRRKPLVERTLPQVNGQNRNWRSDYGEPNAYMSQGPQLWLVPVPGVAMSGFIRAHTQEAALVNTADTMTRIPYHYHEAVADLAAILACASDGANPARTARAEFLVSLFEMTYPDLNEIVRARSFLPNLQNPVNTPQGGNN